MNDKQERLPYSQRRLLIIFIKSRCPAAAYGTNYLIMKYLQIQIKDDGIIFSGWHNYPMRYNIEYATEEQHQALIKWVEQDLFPFIQDMHEGCKLRYRIVNLKGKQTQL